MFKIVVNLSIRIDLVDAIRTMKASANEQVCSTVFLYSWIHAETLYYKHVLDLVCLAQRFGQVKFVCQISVSLSGFSCNYFPSILFC